MTQAIVKSAYLTSRLGTACANSLSDKVEGGLVGLVGIFGQVTGDNAPRCSGAVLAFYFYSSLSRLNRLNRLTLNITKSYRQSVEADKSAVAAGGAADDIHPWAAGYGIARPYLLKKGPAKRLRHRQLAYFANLFILLIELIGNGAAKPSTEPSTAVGGQL